MTPLYEAGIVISNLLIESFNTQDHSHGSAKHMVDLLELCLGILAYSRIDFEDISSERKGPTRINLLASLAETSLLSLPYLAQVEGSFNQPNEIEINVADEFYAVMLSHMHNEHIDLLNKLFNHQSRRDCHGIYESMISQLGMVRKKERKQFCGFLSNDNETYKKFCVQWLIEKHLSLQQRYAKLNYLDDLLSGLLVFVDSFNMLNLHNIGAHFMHHFTII